MFKKIMLFVCLFTIYSCSQVNEKNSGLTPESLNGMTLDVEITSIEQAVIPEKFQRSEGTSSTYFSASELFYDGTNHDGSHFVTQYTINKVDHHSLIINAQTPASPMNPKQYNVKQTLVFDSPEKGKTRIEVFEGELLLISYKGSFTLSNRPFVLLKNGMINRIYTFNLTNANDTATHNGLKQGEKIEAHFASDNSITFTLNGKKFLSKTNTINESGLSKSTISGTIDQTNTPYKIDLNYIDYRAGSFVVELDNGKSKASGNFTSMRYTDVPLITLKGSLIQGKTFSSAITGITYPYEIYLPPGYEKSKKKYPVVYSTDGQWQKGFAHVLEAHNKEVIYISIEQGPTDRRMVDYILPGATTYSKFLKAEFIPFIEANYRTNGVRTYTGQSAGGTLGAVLISEESGHKPYFKNYILADGAFWALSPEILAAEEAHYQQNKKLPINILLSGTWQGNGLLVREYEQRFRARNYEGLTIINKTYPLTHEEMSPPTFTDYVDYVE
ncbi:MAG: alpha/beta hydrolase-fold protein [Cellvibrio sp.]|uniref:alpha/beta hydrolase n=1 Tax=Cellvibrio sp. TaxID=1965322 RepID=UPI0031A63342